MKDENAPHEVERLLQERFQANPEIYGNFREKGDALAEMFKKFRKERRRR